jgi:cyclic beta-1,2-glucan synthetase
VLLRISGVEKIEIVRQLVQAHSYWRMKGLAVELVILGDDVSVYRQSLHDSITNLIASGIEAQMLDKPGGIFVRRLEQVPHDDLILLQTAARVILDDENGTLAQQLEHHRVIEPPVAAFTPTRGARPDATRPVPTRELIFSNGLGGFTRDGHEYVITLEAGQVTPAPWVNVIANPSFGTVVSESGSAYTWAENAHEFRLTPWNNDAVRDPTGEALYIRDEQTGQFWSPSPLPARGATPYVVRHGFGYTVFEHTENGIASELWVYVAMDAPVKFMVLKLRSTSERPAPGLGHRLLGMGAVRAEAQEPAARAHRGGPEDRRPPGAKPLQHRVLATASRSWTSTTRRAPSPGTGGNSWAATGAWRGRPPRARAALGPGRGGARPLRRRAGHGRPARLAGAGR